MTFTIEIFHPRRRRCDLEWMPAKKKKHFSAPFVWRINYCFQCCGDGEKNYFRQLNKSTVNWLLMCQPLRAFTSAYCFNIFSQSLSPLVSNRKIYVHKRSIDNEWHTFWDYKRSLSYTEYQLSISTKFPPQRWLLKSAQSQMKEQ